MFLTVTFIHTPVVSIWYFLIWTKEQKLTKPTANKAISIVVRFIQF